VETGNQWDNWLTQVTWIQTNDCFQILNQKFQRTETVTGKYSVTQENKKGSYQVLSNSKNASKF